LKNTRQFIPLPGVFLIAGLPSGIYRLTADGSLREGRGRHGRLCPIVFAIFIPNTYNDMVNDKIVPISENQSIS
jgi:hypothetical protein